MTSIHWAFSFFWFYILALFISIAINMYFNNTFRKYDRARHVCRIHPRDIRLTKSQEAELKRRIKNRLSLTLKSRIRLSKQKSASLCLDIEPQRKKFVKQGIEQMAVGWACAHNNRDYRRWIGICRILFERSRHDKHKNKYGIDFENEYCPPYGLVGFEDE